MGNKRPESEVTEKLEKDRFKWYFEGNIDSLVIYKMERWGQGGHQKWLWMVWVSGRHCSTIVALFGREILWV